MLNIIPICTTVAATFAILFLIYTILKTSHPVLNSIKSAALGTVSIIILSASSSYTGIAIPLNLASIGIAAVLGLPGIGTIAVLNTLLT